MAFLQHCDWQGWILSLNTLSNCVSIYSFFRFTVEHSLNLFNLKNVRKPKKTYLNDLFCRSVQRHSIWNAGSSERLVFSTKGGRSGGNNDIIAASECEYGLLVCSCSVDLLVNEVLWSLETKVGGHQLPQSLRFIRDCGRLQNTHPLLQQWNVNFGAWKHIRYLKQQYCLNRNIIRFTTILVCLKPLDVTLTQLRFKAANCF